MSALASSQSEEWHNRSLVSLANFLAELGRINEASFVLEQGIAHDHSRGQNALESDKKLRLAYLHYQENKLELARQYALDASTSDRSAAGLLATGTLLARVGLISEAKAALAQILSGPSFQRTEFAIYRLRGEIDLTQGNFQSAISNLNQAARLARPRERDDYLARALRVAGRNDAARQAYKNLVDHPARIWLYGDSSIPGLWAASATQFLRLVEQPEREDCRVLADLVHFRHDADHEEAASIDDIHYNVQSCPTRIF